MTTDLFEVFRVKYRLTDVSGNVYGPLYMGPYTKYSTAKMQLTRLGKDLDTDTLSLLYGTIQSSHLDWSDIT